MSGKTITTMSWVVVSMWLIWGCHSINPRAWARENIQEIKSPAPVGSLSPRVTEMRDGSVLLTWLEPENDTTASLRSSFWRSGAWSSPASVVTAQPFSRHPSESPGLIALSETNLIAYWSQKPSTEKTPAHEVDVYFAVSTDRGAHWTGPTLASSAGTDEESSYPSAAPVDATHAELIWLDGANWKKQNRVSLISRLAQADGTATDPTVVDPDTCTCCPTSIVQAGSGLVAAYRGHTPENIRDISLLRNVQGRWSQPRIVHADHWHFAGCPVNGPHLDADQKRTAMTWFTAAQDQPAVNLAFSDDGGATFTPPIRVDEGNPAGRAQVVLLPGRSAVAFWLEHSSGTTQLLTRTVYEDGEMEKPIEVSRGSDLGYPHGARAAVGVLITWAERDPVRRVHMARLPVTGHKEEQ